VSVICDCKRVLSIVLCRNLAIVEILIVSLTTSLYLNIKKKLFFELSLTVLTDCLKEKYVNLRNVFFGCGWSLNEWNLLAQQIYTSSYR